MTQAGLMTSSSGLFLDLTAFTELLEYEHVHGYIVNTEVKAENKGRVTARDSMTCFECLEQALLFIA